MNLAEISYYRTGGEASLFFAPNTLEELSDQVRFCARRCIPYQLLGAGSNSLVSDVFYPGAMISLQQLNHLQVKGERLICGAGVDNTKLSETAFESGLAGLGWMNGLPGSIGATARMNARCYGGEISQVVTGVTVVDSAGQIHQLDLSSKKLREQAFKGYKDTRWMKTSEIIAQVELTLLPERHPEKTLEKMRYCLEDRRSKHQFDYPSCGCVFKNDYRTEVGVSSGLLLDLAGAKRVSSLRVAVSEYHANFLFNLGGASSRDILELSFQMRELVYQEFGVWLEYEMEFLGVMPKDLAATFKERRIENFKIDRLMEARQLFHKRS